MHEHVVHKRTDKLFALGLRFNGQEYCLKDFNVHWTEITCDTNEVFDDKVRNIEAEMKRRKELAI
jgi:hypothetical protein